MPVSGMELGGKIQKALGLPEGVIWFELRCHVSEAAIVKCEYYPDVDIRQKDGVLLTELAEYRLEKIDPENKESGKIENGNS